MFTKFKLCIKNRQNWKDVKPKTIQYYVCLHLKYKKYEYTLGKVGAIIRPTLKREFY